MQDPGRRTFSFCLASHYSRREVPSYSRREANALNFPSFRARREEKEEEDICRQDDSAREGGREGIGTTDGIRSGRERKGARIADRVEMRWHWGRE